MTAPSRRAALAALTAATGLSALKVSPSTAADPDPVFALIAAEQEAETAFMAAIDGLTAADDAFAATGLDRAPCVEIGVSETWREGVLTKSEPSVAYTREGIEEAFSRPGLEPLDLRYWGGSLRIIHRSTTTLTDALADFDAQEAEIGAARRRAGIEGAKVRESETSDAQRAALRAVCSATPTTPAGLLAVIDLFEAREGDSLSCPADEFLAGIFAAVRSILAKEA